MGKKGYLAMKVGQASYDGLIESDLNELGVAARRLAGHAFTLFGEAGFGTTTFKFLASVAAIYLLILDRTNWRTNMLTALLVPYIFLTLPTMIFSIFRGEFGKWIAIIGVVLRLFFHKHYPEWLEIPGALILLLVVAPDFIAQTIRNDWVGVVICLGIGCYLLQEHIRAAGGFRDAFTKSHGILNTIGIILLFAYPVWASVLYLL